MEHGRNQNVRATGVVTFLSSLLRFIAFVVLAISVAFAVLGQYWIAALGGISPFSTGAISGLYLLTDSRLRRDGASAGESIIPSILFANVFVQAFEIVYHFSFPVYLNYFRPPFFDGSEIRYLVLEGVMLVPVLLVRRHLRFGALSAGLLACFFVAWTTWVLFGFPQYFTGSFYYPRFFVASNPYHLSLFLDFGAKTILALFFASLVWHPNRGFLASARSPAPRQ
jgi:hypothetical protein